MKLVSAFLAAGICAVALTAAQAQDKTYTVGIAPEPYLPYSTLNAANQWEGYEPDMIRAICEEAKLKCEFTAIAWEGLIPSLTNNKVDIIVGAFTINAERQKVVDFLTPYDFETTHVIGAKSDKTEIGLTKDPADPAVEILDEKTMTGKVVGVQSSSTQSKYAATYLKSLEIKNYDTADNILADMVIGRVDYTMVGSNFSADFLKSDNGKDYHVAAVVPRNPVEGEGGIAAAVNKGNTELLNKLETALATLEKNGKREELSKKWFPYRYVK
ncbi:MAG: transporter substrate-binding domain-containing protein [Methylobacteriaceae bacterium]|jgi:polar amino acid transport system substrate-binding protein|nr:transporter substrate-binding domain-containing protein [Methylobacteriaceae bacterium]